MNEITYAVPPPTTTKSAISGISVVLACTTVCPLVVVDGDAFTVAHHCVARRINCTEGHIESENELDRSIVRTRTALIGASPTPILIRERVRFQAGVLRPRLGPWMKNE